VPGGLNQVEREAPQRADRARILLRDLFDTAVEAADPVSRIAAALPAPPRGRTVVVGAGKASARMAQVVEKAWPGHLTGMVVTARALPAPGIRLADKQRVTTELLRSGAPIGPMNVVRKHLSAIKGGRLAAAAFPARTVGLLVSDVPGDDVGVIASGPTVPEVSAPTAALAIVERHGVRCPPAVAAALRDAGGCPGPADPRMSRVTNHLVATPQQSLVAAADLARRAGVRPLILSDSIEGEAREAGAVLAGIARQVRRHGQPAGAPCVLLSGGETTVTVRGPGHGGRNTEFLLALALALRGEPGVYALAADTDGVDGTDEVAGAIITPDTLARARMAGADPAASLEGSDAHGFFAALGDQVVTGPTGTNVNDFRAILVV
jgi:hydroxypyruvate reductase